LLLLGHTFVSYEIILQSYAIWAFKVVVALRSSHMEEEKESYLYGCDGHEIDNP
jgi:hypothetical protein